MAGVETRIIVNINAIVNGLRDVQALGLSVEGVGKFASSASGGLGKFDGSMSKTQREAQKLIAELNILQKDLAALNKQIAKDGRFAFPADIAKAKELSDTIASHQSRINALNQSALRQTLGSIDKVSKGIALKLFAPLRSVVGFVTGIFSQVIRQVQFLIASFVLLAASSPFLVFSLLIKEGLHFLSVMEQQKIGLAALIQSTNDLFLKGQPNKPLQGIEAYNAATIVAEASTKRLSIKIIPLKATLEELLPIFNQIVTAGAAAGLTLEQTENVFTELAAAAQVINLPLDKLGTGIRLLLNGTARATTVLATALFGSAKAANAWVKEHKQIGDLADALHKKLEPFRLALITSESSFAVLAANTKDVFQRLAGIATSGLFEKLKASLVSILQSFYDLQNLQIRPEFEQLFNFLNDELTEVGEFIARLTGRVIEYVRSIAKYVQDNRVYVEQIIQQVIIILEQLGLIILQFGYILSDIALAAKGTGTWLELLQYIAEVLGGIRDALNVVIGAFQFLAGEIAAGILAPLYVVLDVLGLISQSAADAAKRIDEVRQASKDFANRGGEKFLSGINEEGRNGVIAEQQARKDDDLITIDAGNSENVALHDIETRLKKFGTGGEGKGGGKAGERVLNRLGELRKQTADLLRDIAKVRIDIERAAEDSSFDLFKSASDKQVALLDDDFKHRLTSTLAYFQKRKEIEDAAFERERKHLTDQFKFEERGTTIATNAVNEAFDAQAAEPKNKDARIQAELSKQRQLKLAAEQGKLEEKRVKLNKDLASLDQQHEESTRRNNLGLEDGLETLRKTNEQIQEQLLESQGRTTAAEIRRIAEQYKDELLTVLTETNPATDALKSVIESIKELGSVTTDQLLGILDQAGIAFEDLSAETKALITLINRLANAAVFKGLQTEAQNKLGNLDVTRADVQDRINLGVITEAKGRHEIALAERAVRVELDRVIELMEHLPGLTDEESLALKQLKQQASQMGREIDQLGSTINDSIKSNLESFGDSLIDDFQNIGSNARKFFANLIADIGKAILRAVVLQQLFDALGLNKQGTQGPGSAGGVGGFLSRIFGGIQGHAEGGLVTGPSGRDNLLRRLTNEEWVIPADRVRQYGHGLMQSITDGTFGRGIGSALHPALPNGSSSRPLPDKHIWVWSRDELANEVAASTQFRKVIIHEIGKVRGGLGF